MSDPMLFDHLGGIMHDLFYSSLQYQHQGDYATSLRQARGFNALIKVHEMHKQALPEPFASTPFEVLAERFLSEMGASPDPGDGDTEPWMLEA